jgi:hypothetical protein
MFGVSVGSGGIAKESGMKPKMNKLVIKKIIKQEFLKVKFREFLVVLSILICYDYLVQNWWIPLDACPKR